MIELLVVLLIVAILAAAAVPIYQSYLDESRIKGASEGLYHSLILARTEAIKQQANITVVFQTGASWCYGATTASTCDCTIAAACNLGQSSYTEYRGVSLSLTGIVNKVTFEGYRGEVTPSGTIGFSSSSNTIDVSLNPLGRAGICSDNVGGYVAC